MRPALTLGTAAGVTVAAAAVVAKLASIGALAVSEIGRERLASEVSVARVLAWFAPDVLLGLGWGAATALLVGWIRSRVVAHSLLSLPHLAIAVLLAGATLVYTTFGVAPTWGLLGNLGNAGFGDAEDSFWALLGGPPLVLLIGLLALVLVGTPLLDRALCLRRRPTSVGAIGLVGLAGVLSTARVLAPPSALELDKNGMVQFLASAFHRQPPPAAVSGDLRDVLRAPTPASPIDARAEAAYASLSRWGRQRPRNVVLAVLESMPAGQLQISGGPEANTPELVRLSRRALLWPRHYAHTPNSMFAIYALLGANHGLPGGAPITETRPRVACRSLSEVLTERGWAASLWHSGRFSYYKKDLFLVGRGFDPMHDAVTMPGADRHAKTSWGIREEPTVDALLDWARSRPAGRPWIATYISVYPHHPYDVPSGAGPNVRGGRLAKFRNAARYIDRMVGRLADGLRDAGVENDTLLLVLGDHGEGFGEHPGSTLHGTTLYDEGARTFALWVAPGALHAPVVDARAFGHVDIVPTLLDAMGIPVPEEHPGTPAARVDRPMVPLYTGNGIDHVGFVDGRWKFVHRANTGVSELYDLTADPAERRSMAALAPDRVEVYRARARAFVAAQAAWERGLADHRGGATVSAPRIAQRTERWPIDPVTCEHDSNNFAVQEETLRPTRPGFLIATCSRPVVASGRITELRVTGHEAVNGSLIWVSLQWLGPDGNRREVAYCEMNGNTSKPSNGCKARLVDGRSDFGAGGRLVAELRYDLKNRPAPVDRYSIGAVEAGFVLDNVATIEPTP